MKDVIDFALRDDEARDREKALELQRKQLEEMKKTNDHLRPDDFHIVMKVDFSKIHTRDELFDGPGSVEYYDTMTIAPQVIDYQYEIERGKLINVYAGDSVQLSNIEIYSLWITTTSTDNSIMEIFLAGKFKPE